MRVPGLKGLWAFEVTARHMSMKDAAAELFVTPSAVSQLLRGLERELGVSLFQRGARTLCLTREGQELLPSVRNGFRLIADGADRLRRGRDDVDGVLTIGVTAFFAESWLVPRMSQFAEAHPEIDLRVTTSVAVSDLKAGATDIAIRHGLGDYPGMASELIAAPPVVPVAAPSLVARFGMPRGPADLVRWPKIQDTDRGGWTLWFTHQRVPDGSVIRGPCFDDSALMRAAILQGQGVGLLPAPFIEADVHAGTLVAVGPSAKIDNFAYYLVTPKASAVPSKVAAFRTWIKQQAASR